MNILTWRKERFDDRLKRESFGGLFTKTDYEVMTMTFAKRFSPSQINKHRQRFCLLVNFAKLRPFRVRLSFGPDDVRQFGGVEKKREREGTCLAPYTVRRSLLTRPHFLRGDNRGSPNKATGFIEPFTLPLPLPAREGCKSQECQR